MLEMLTVICLIGMLASMLSFAVNSARKQARQADCKSNLRQFGAAILVYRGEHEGRNPPWMSKLFPEYVDDKHLFVCRSDKNKGVGLVRPADLPPEEVSVSDTFPEVIDNDSVVRHPLQYPDIKANSYFYEFSAADAPTSWKPGVPDLDEDGKIAWWEYKENQLRVGDKANRDPLYPNIPKPYSQSRMPIIRCYHHHRELRIEGHRRNNTDGTKVTTRPIPKGGITLNVAYAGNVLVAPLWWEGALEPGEKP
jgi:type II secretory pathway pseudopilin PulG